MKEDLSPRLRALGSADMRKTLLGLIQVDVVRHAKTLVPQKTRNLYRSIRRGAIDDKHALILAGGIRDVGYAAFVEFGTSGGQMLRPVHKKVLAWGGPRRLSGTLRSGAKAEFFSMGHRRGATRAKPYLGPGLEAAVRDFSLKDGIVKAWNDAA